MKQGSFAERVFHFSNGHAMFAPRDVVGVAVSGGADSVCLLHILLELCARWPIELKVLHVDHQLRGDESTADAQFVERLAANYSLPFHLERIEISKAGNLEENARHLRMAFFERLRAVGAVYKIATGHTASDQAETVLFRFLRGSGVTGLAGILPVTREGLVRPLLEWKREEVEEFLKSRGIAWREDSTNRSSRYTRNRIRHELIPLLKQEYQPALVDQFGQLAAMARDEDLFWQEVTAQHYRQVAGPGPVLDCSKLSQLNRALLRRIVRMALKETKGDLNRIDYEHVEAVLSLLDRKEGGTVQVPGVTVTRSFQWIRFVTSDRLGAQEGCAVSLQVPGEVVLPGGGRLCLRSLTPERGYNSGEVGRQVSEDKLDWDRLDGPLILRWWMPGDAYQPAGARQAGKIKQMFQMARIPLWERRFWPIIETGQGIVWCRRFGPSAVHQATPSSRRVLGVQEIPAE